MVTRTKINHKEKIRENAGRITIEDLVIAKLKGKDRRRKKIE